ncbi:protein IQ-DOMAIN 20-like [Lotus japonicus]|uniref:protein IQ-DOMAIN 20-like n=1 Tax=Lotus japonicus TaxID=34305 RepID=UPI002590DEFA|nr:protein IQ-DOMAIN 20-like [Lotus japonicus]
MGASHKWLRIVRSKFLRSSNKDKIILPPRTSVCTNQSELPILKDVATNSTTTENFTNLPIPPTSSARTFPKEQIAAIRIQAYFRGHLARRAYGALRSLVKLQALVRGVCVRRQSRIAMQCMHALVRLQVRIRARQLLGGID